MNQIPMLTALFLVVGFASAADVIEFDLTQHRVEPVKISIPPQLKEFYGWAKEFQLFENVLEFEGLKSKIRLARSAWMRPFATGGLEQLGFDRETVKIQWLDRGRLIWVKWGTVPQGQGRYSKQGHLILRFDGKNLKELFRDSIYAYGKSGMYDSSKFDLDIHYEPSIAALSLVRSALQRSSSETEWPFYDDQYTTDQGNTIYYGQSNTRTVWRYRIENEQLRFVSGERFADLTKDYSVLAIAEALRVPSATLLRLNPNLNASEHASGTLCLDDRIGPYQHEKDDGI